MRQFKVLHRDLLHHVYIYHYWLYVVNVELVQQGGWWKKTTKSQCVAGVPADTLHVRERLTILW